MMPMAWKLNIGFVNHPRKNVFPQLCLIKAKNSSFAQLRLLLRAQKNFEEELSAARIEPATSELRGNHQNCLISYFCSNKFQFLACQLDGPLLENKSEPLALFKL